MPWIVKKLWILTFLFCLPAAGQNVKPSVYLNHIYIVLDSTSYERIFDSSSISKKLFYQLSYATRTNQNSYSGKYLAGKNGYMEFFTPATHGGLSTGSIGLGFMTKKSGDIKWVEEQWRKKEKDSVAFETVQQYTGDLSRSWYYDLERVRPDTFSRLHVWLMENTPEDLLAAGFTPEEISHNKIRWQEYIERQNKTSLTRAFDRILSIKMEVSRQELAYLKKSLQGMGLRHTGRSFHNADIRINYRLNAKPQTRIKAVEIKLSEKFPTSRLIINDHVHVFVNGKKARLYFF